MPFNLQEYRIAESDAFYIPDFINEVEEAYLIRKILEAPRQKWRQLANRRLQLLGGELTKKNVLLSQEMPTWMNSYPDLISRLRATEAFSSSPHEGPNHVILNEYLPGHGIMPHEDGPSYYPVVATISLGSHTVFNYYEYTSDDATPHSQNAPQGRAINPTPVLTLLLEPRSVVITRSQLYTTHLHGINDTEVDEFRPKGDLSPPTVSPYNASIANWTKLTDPDIKQAVESGGSLKRGTRYSLTCRDVERVVATSSLISKR
ncbi:hypothetical protein PLEOSDRAFT_34982 [Pleurotus ostreatus PC15]|uniref:Fe2OG dioxygenase domain-containing protein n=1 Tax=Pleurotus ostreatus (strain PC15) TaxID=1137138 RepID=A0A067N811_PLEO1|nr:hypothetical protein PLEOSDRAFT_34982 [Pleurotus ostreatus PC15]